MGCPFDRPRPERTEGWEEIARLSVSTAALFRNQGYRGHCLVIFDLRHASRPDELSSSEWAAFAQDAREVARAVMEVCAPDHLNLELLGNQVPHLHWHVVPRYRDDPRWGNAIWTTTGEELQRAELPEAEWHELRMALATSLRQAVPP